MIIWFVLAVLTGAAVLAVLVPLSRRRDTASHAALHDREVYRDQMEELERERAAGLIGESEAAAARTEIARRLLAADKEAGEEKLPSGHLMSRRVAALIGLVFVPVLSIGLYLALGAPDLPPQPLQARLDMPPERQSVEDLVARVEDHLSRNPEDGPGWEVLAPTYLRIGRTADAARAYGNAIRILGSTPGREANLGEAIVAANGGIVTGNARQAFERALQRDEAHPKARFFLALASEQEGDLTTAAERWSDLFADSPTDAPWRPIVAASLERLKQEMGDDWPIPETDLALNDEDPSTPLEPRTEQVQPQTAGPTQEDIEAASALSAEDRMAMIGSMVDGLSARLETESGNVDEWLQLVRAYMVLGRDEDAVMAAERAVADLPEAEAVRIRVLVADHGLTLNEERNP